jgi:hypothetical protein
MNRLEERSTDELRRRIVLQRRELLVLIEEFGRLRAARATAPLDAREGLLVEIDAVAERHFEVSTALDCLTDDLIRLDRDCQVRTARWRRPWRGVAVY